MPRGTAGPTCDPGRLAWGASRRRGEGVAKAWRRRGEGVAKAKAKAGGWQKQKQNNNNYFLWKTRTLIKIHGGIRIEEPLSIYIQGATPSCRRHPFQERRNRRMIDSKSSI